MTVAEIAASLSGTVAVAPPAGAPECRGGYASDLLSDVMAHAQDGDVWVTLQKHVNVVAVAELKNLAAIVVVNGREPDAETRARAAEHGVSVVVTPLSAFDAAGRLYALGLRGRTVS
jgi:hypothetical protein